MGIAGGVFVAGWCFWCGAGGAAVDGGGGGAAMFFCDLWTGLGDDSPLGLHPGLVRPSLAEGYTLLLRASSVGTSGSALAL